MRSAAFLTILVAVASAAASVDGAPATRLSAGKLPLLSPRAADALHGAVATVPASVPRGGVLPAQLGALKVPFYFAAWYLLNIVYNIQNKRILNLLPAPVTVGSLQLGVGALYATALWTLRLRAAPALTPAGKSALGKVGFYHAAGQLLSMVSLGAGAVSFTHIVKALEPFFSAVVSALYLGAWMRPQVYATLVPVVGGVAAACLTDLSFTWLGFYSAMGSNLMFALRAVMSKAAMTSDIGTNTSATNVFGVVTVCAFFLSVPAALATDAGGFPALWKAAVAAAGVPAVAFARRLAVSGLVHYLNNEVMYLALDSVHPVTLAVANTMKRVFIIIASVVAFQTPVSLQTAVGSGIGIAGVLLYSLTKQYYEKLDAVE